MASVVTLAMTATYLLVMRSQDKLGTLVVVVMTPFVLAGLGLAALAVREAVRILRHGTWAVEIPDGGGRVGEPLPVRIYPARLSTATGPMQLTLRCRESTTHHSRGTQGSETNTMSRTLGSVEVQLTPGALDPRSPVAATLDVPHGLPPSSGQNALGVTIAWQLIVEVPTTEGDAFTTFDLPVAR